MMLLTKFGGGGGGGGEGRGGGGGGGERPVLKALLCSLLKYTFFMRTSKIKTPPHNYIFDFVSAKVEK